MFKNRSRLDSMSRYEIESEKKLLNSRYSVSDDISDIDIGEDFTAEIKWLQGYQKYAVN